MVTNKNIQKMRILRRMAIILAAFSLLVSCTKNLPDNYDPDMVISFRPAVGMVTKTDGLSFPETSTFGVWAFALEKGLTWSKDAASAKPWISGSTVAFSNGVWKTTDARMWNEKSGSMTFLAYAPTDLKMKYDNAKGLCYEGHDILKDSTDILFTDPVTDVNKIDVAGEVAVPFRHALSKVEVRIFAIDTQEAELHIKSIKMGNVAYKGDFSSVPPVWTVKNDRTELEFCDEEFVLTKDEKQLKSLQVMPQTGERPLIVTYDLYLKGKKFLVDQKIAAKPVMTTWEVGRNYIYALEMTLDSVVYKTDILD